MRANQSINQSRSRRFDYWPPPHSILLALRFAIPSFSLSPPPSPAHYLPAFSPCPVLPYSWESPSFFPKLPKHKRTPQERKERKEKKERKKHTKGGMMHLSYLPHDVFFDSPPRTEISFSSLNMFSRVLTTSSSTSAPVMPFVSIGSNTFFPHVSPHPRIQKISSYRQTLILMSPRSKVRSRRCST